MDFKTALKDVVKGEILDDPQTLDTFSKDASVFVMKPKVVVAPKNTEDIENLVKFVNTHKSEKLSLTPRAAGTCMSGGSLSESIVLDMTKHFNEVKEVKEESAVTQPGVFYRDFEKETLKKGLLLPCYTSSRELCTVGGMVANNSAGEKTLSFGQTERWVKQLKMVLSDGNEYVIKPLTKEQLHKKMDQSNFEGMLYRRLFRLIDNNFTTLQKARPKTSKNSAGYYLWNVWNKQVFDLTKLIVGSQGTLGIVTEVEFKLIKPKKKSAMLVVQLPDLKQLDKVVNMILDFEPESFECFDDQTLRASMKYITDLEHDFKQSHGLKVYWKLLPEYWSYLTGNLPKLVLIAEFTGDNEGEEMELARKAEDALSVYNVKTQVVPASEEEKYWMIRRDSFNVLRHHSGKDLRTCPFIDDIVVRPEQLPEFLPRLQKTLAPYKNKIIYTIAGHIGNGNFHIIPLMNLNKPEIRALIPEISKKVFDLVFEFEGSMAAEHNDGLVRGPYLKQMYGEKVYSLFKEVKEIFDPENIFNPHKKVDATLDFSTKHIGSNTGIVGNDYKNVASTFSAPK